MKSRLVKNYRKFSLLKKKRSILQRFFNAFLPEAIYRNTKIEHPRTSRKNVFSILK